MYFLLEGEPTLYLGDLFVIILHPLLQIPKKLLMEDIRRLWRVEGLNNSWQKSFYCIFLVCLNFGLLRMLGKKVRKHSPNDGEKWCWIPWYNPLKKISPSQGLVGRGVYRISDSSFSRSKPWGGNPNFWIWFSSQPPSKLMLCSCCEKSHAAQCFLTLFYHFFLVISLFQKAIR